MGLLSSLTGIGESLSRLGRNTAVPFLERALTNVPKRIGLIGAAYLGNQAVQGGLSYSESLMRGYYGDKEYESRYKMGLDYASTTSSALAGYVGVTQALNISPLAGAGKLIGGLGVAGVRKMGGMAATALNNRRRAGVIAAKRAAVASNSRKATALANKWAAREATAAQRLRYQQVLASSYEARGIPAPNNAKLFAAIDAAEEASDINRTLQGVSNNLRIRAETPRGKIKFRSRVSSGPTQIKNHHWLGQMAMVGGFAAGLSLGGYYRRISNNRAVPEGNITAFGSENTAGKLNFSTAGLVQALHSSRRRLD